MSEIRKVRAAAGGDRRGESIIISLPKPICEKLDIKIGDHVKITERGKKIVLEKV